MRKSDKIIEALIMANIIDSAADKDKAAIIINRHLKQLHNEAVLETVMAHNKPQFFKPEFKE